MEINEYLEKICLSKQAIDGVTELYTRLGKTKEFQELYNDICNDRNYFELVKDVDAYAEKIGVHKYKIYLTLLSTALPIMEQRYHDKGLSEEMFWALAKDLRYKDNECELVNGFWGVEPFTWYEYNYKLKRFALGRLQFEPNLFYRSDHYQGVVSLRKGDPVIDIHIPSGSPLNYEDMMDSFRRAAEFFGPNNGNKIVFHVSTWLIYPPYCAFYKEDSNLKKFADLFDLYLTVDYPTDTFKDGWRVFGTRDLTDLSKLPADTSLRQSFIEYMKHDPHYGYGVGVFAFPCTTAK